MSISRVLDCITYSFVFKAYIANIFIGWFVPEISLEVYGFLLGMLNNLALHSLALM